MNAQETFLIMLNIEKMLVEYLNLHSLTVGIH